MSGTGTAATANVRLHGRVSATGSSGVAAHRTNGHEILPLRLRAGRGGAAAAVVTVGPMPGGAAAAREPGTGAGPAERATSTTAHGQPAASPRRGTLPAQLLQLQGLAGNRAVAASLAAARVGAGRAGAGRPRSSRSSPPPAAHGIDVHAPTPLAVALQRAPADPATAAPTTIPEGGVPVGKTGIVNRDKEPQLRLRASPDTTSDANVLRSLPFNTHVQVVKEFPGGWYFVSTPTGDLGYVASSYVWTKMPEPNARLHRVEAGISGTAIAIAEKYYKQYADDWGQDLRFYVNVLAWANKVPVPDTTDGWKQVHFDAGDLRWVPSYEFARSLKGVVNSGSISYNIADALGLADAIERVAQLWDDIRAAVSLSTAYLKDAVARYAEQAVWDALYSLAVTLVGAIAILAISTAIGAAVGALAGGAGAAPGAAAGFEVGMALLEWLGLAMLVTWVAQALWDTAKAFGSFFAMVWNARGDQKAIDRAARQFAEAVGLLIGKLLEAIIMYAASQGLALGLRGLQNSKIGKSMGRTAARDWLTERVRRVRAGEGPLPGPRQVAARFYRGVELYDAKKSPIGEFDGVDLTHKVFVENKSAAGLDRVNPKTGKPAQTEVDWAKKRITTKTSRRIDALSKAAGTRPRAGGSATVPTLAEIQGIRHIHFKIDGSTPALRAAVHAELANLRGAHPDWSFTAEFGVDVTAPPVPRSDDDERQPEPAR